MNKKVYLLVFDGLADWEPALALCEIRNTNRFEIVTVGFTKENITTMGGLRVVPDITLDQVDPDQAAIFILPGGDMLEKNSFEDLASLLLLLRKNRTPIAAICGATLAMARAGLLQKVRHTSNARDYLKTMVPDYREEELYIESPAVSDQGIITASGAAPVEFADEIIRLLEIYSEEERQAWFDLFKYGVIPEMSD